MSKKQKRVFWPFLMAMILTLGAVALAHHANLGSLAARKLVTNPNSKSVIPLTVPQSRIGRIETELITITPRGFEPKEITRPAGPFILALENRSGLQSVTLRLNPTEVVPRTGSSVLPSSALFEVTVPRDQPDWNDLETLPPGRYALSESKHSGWLCYITITTR